MSFELTAGPGEPKFQGKVSDDGQTISGDFVQAGSSFPFTLKRMGEAKVYVPAKSPELPASFVGQWEGSLQTMGGKLRLVLHLANREGSANGSMDSLDQGVMGIPMDEISVTNGAINITVRVITGSYTGKLSEDGKTLTGEWSQGGATFPLVLTKASS